MTSAKDLVRARIVLSSWRIFLCFVSFLLLSGCMALEKKMNVEVVVFNYNPQPIARLDIQGHSIGGHYGGYGPGGTGGSSYCCIDVVPGEAKVKWMYAGAEGAPKAGQEDQAVGVIPEPSGEYRYLGVHISPDSTVEFRLTKKYPLDKKYD